MIQHRYLSHLRRHEYYVHYEGFNRRLDEWVNRDRIKSPDDDTPVEQASNNTEIVS